MLIFTKYSIVKKYVRSRNNNIKIRLQIKRHIYKDLHTKKSPGKCPGFYIYNKTEIISILLQHQLLLIAS